MFIKTRNVYHCLVIGLLSFILQSNAYDSDWENSNENISDDIIKPLVACPQTDDPSILVHLPYPNDCTKFYKCDHGEAVLQNCPQGLHWSVQLNRCDWPNVAKCSHPSLSNAEKFLGRNISLDYLCERISDEVISNPYSCSKFILCSNESAYEFVCPNNLLWNYLTKRCDYEGNVNCGYIYNDFVQINNDENSTLKEESNLKEESYGNGIPLSGCPIHGEDPFNPTQLPYPGDCTKFYKCSEGLGYVVNCPPGLHWNAKKSICDWPIEANCQKNEREIPIYENWIELDPYFSKTTCPPQDDPKNPSLLPYPGRCDKFYKCFNGVPVPQNCPAGLHWNAELKVCDWPSSANCQERNVMDILNGFNDFAQRPNCPLQEDPKNPSLFPYPGQCDKFYKCFNGVPVPQNCPTGLLWNSNLKICDWPSNSDCQK